MLKKKVQQLDLNGNSYEINDQQVKKQKKRKRWPSWIF